jgi:hypothetical protein
MLKDEFNLKKNDTKNHPSQQNKLVAWVIRLGKPHRMHTEKIIKFNSQSTQYWKENQLKKTHVNQLNLRPGL